MPTIRNQHEGTREVLPSGKIRYRAEVNGKRVSGSAKKTDRLAIQSLNAAVKLALADNDLNKVLEVETRHIPSLHEYAFDTLDGAYREMVATEDMSESTWELYEMITRVNIKTHAIGALPLDQIEAEPSLIEKWSRGLKTEPRIRVGMKDGSKWGYEEPPRPLAPASKARYIGFIGGLFTRARLLDKFVKSNPVDDIQKPTAGDVDFRILTKPEVSELLQLAVSFQNNFNHGAWKREAANPRLMEMICLLGLHGLGASEMCGVSTSDFIDEGINMSQQVRRGKVKRKFKTKNRKAWIAVSDELCTLIESWPAGYLLQTKKGTAMHDSNVRRLFAALVRGTKFEGMNPYDLRHTFAMRLLEEGVDIKTVAELMRNTAEVVLRNYVRSRPELKKAAVKKLIA